MANDKKEYMVIGDNTDQFLLPLGRVTYHNLFKARAFQEGATLKYGVTMICPPDSDFSAYAEAFARLKKNPEFIKLDAVLPGSKEAQAKIDTGTSPEELKYIVNARKKITDKEKIEQFPYLKDQWSISAKRPEAWGRCPILTASKQTITDENAGLIYNGCYGYALVSLNIHKSTRQLYFTLHGFQKVKEGEPLGGTGGIRSRNDLFQTFTEDSHVPAFEADTI